MKEPAQGGANGLNENIGGTWKQSVKDLNGNMREQKTETQNFFLENYISAHNYSPTFYHCYSFNSYPSKEQSFKKSQRITSKRRRKHLHTENKNSDIKLLQTSSQPHHYSLYYHYQPSTICSSQLLQIMYNKLQVNLIIIHCILEFLVFWGDFSWDHFGHKSLLFTLSLVS
ncbi:hypothetical protein KSP40_PGU000818 [Platanthera guangdongensis]|uniref:Uncharacterized protein n=1 Tax=Platanthera guangdongensis TaxID=2320717 RepID=A0ABR2MBV7_9ASPA